MTAFITVRVLDAEETASGSTYTVTTNRRLAHRPEAQR